MATHLTVTQSEALTPTLRRVWFSSDDLLVFRESRFTDRYVKLVFPIPPKGEITWVHRKDTSADGQLEAAVRAVEWSPRRVHAFVHGEAHEVMHGIRPYLLKERKLPRADVSISGYWRRGRSEDGFRVWKSELAEAEAEGGDKAERAT